MIIDAYITTRYINYINLTIITDDDSHLTIIGKDKTITLKNPDISFKGLFYYQYKWQSSLISINLKIMQNNHINGLNTSLLKPPGGQKIKIFGILPDTHINDDNIDYLPKSTKRLYGQANYLCKKYIKRIEELGADFIVYPGDIINSGSFHYLNIAQKIITQSQIPYYPIIGNHEEYGEVSREDFYKAFRMPKEGYYSFTVQDIHFIMLDTPSQSSLNKNTEQFHWLKKELDKYGFTHKILLFSHFSLLLHPCVQGWKNDGMQQIYNYKEVLDLFNKYPGVKVFFAGHKNVPSRIIKEGINHLLCPQLIQAPCGFYLVDLYEKGLICSYHEIDEKHYIQVSRNAFGQNWTKRFGTEESRNFVLYW